MNSLEKLIVDMMLTASVGSAFAAEVLVTAGGAEKSRFIARSAGHRDRRKRRA